MTEICSHTPTQYVLQFDRNNITLDPGNMASKGITHRNKNNCTSYKYKGNTKPVKYTQNIEKLDNTSRLAFLETTRTSHLHPWTG